MAAVDKIVLPRMRRIQAEIIREHDMKHNMRLLSERERKWQAYVPVARVGECARQCRRQCVPIPDMINDRVVDDIIWQYDNAYGDRETDAVATGSRAEWNCHREVVAGALGFIGNPRGIPIILDAIANRGGYPAWAGLEGIADNRAIPLIEKHLDLSCQQDARPAIAMLGKTGEAGIPTLARFAGGKDRALAVEAIEALLKIGSPKAVPVLEEARRSTDPGVREKATTAIALIICRKVDQVWTPHPLSETEEWKLRHLSEVMLWGPGMTGEEAIPDDLDPRCASLFIKLGAKGLPVLREVLSNKTHGDGPGGPVWIVTPKIAELMVRIGDEAVPCLIDALNDEYPHVRTHAAQSLRKITGQDFGSSYDKWKVWFKGNRHPTSAN